jgi:hypothetical protein
MNAADVEQASLYDEVSADHLAPNEPRPGAPLGRIESMIDRLHSGNGGSGSRDDKHRRDDRSPQPESNPSTPQTPAAHAQRHAGKMSRLVVLAGVAIAIVVLAASVALASRGGDDPPSAAASPTTTEAGAANGSTISRAVSSTPTTSRRAAAPPTTAAPIRFSGKGTVFSAERGATNGTCANGATPGKVMVWTTPNRFMNGSAYADPPPAGVTAFEMTWVGADRYEVLFPKGAVEIGRTGQEVVADCSGTTTRKSGQSLISYSLETDIENKPITDQPFVIISGKVDPRFNDCLSPAKPVDVKVQWGVVEDDSGRFDPSSIFEDAPMQLGPDGVYRASIETRHYWDELMIVGHYETSHYRCDWGNG